VYQFFTTKKGEYAMGKPLHPDKNASVSRIISLGLVLPIVLVIMSLLVVLPASAIDQPQAGAAQADLSLRSSTGLLASSSNQLLQLDNPLVVPDSLQVLHSFDGTDGSSPNSLMQVPGGLFYGTTGSGGDTVSCAPDGCGILFSVDTGGNYTILHTFHATDGYLPTGLFLGSDNNFYGTTISGGQPSGGGSGTIFRIDTSGTLTTLYRFVGGLIQSRPLTVTFTVSPVLGAPSVTLIIPLGSVLSTGLILVQAF
jgi:uncharacterized repeat protein (TIGR03803 family)